jgi:DNA-binding MarR family transcriptional regulator
MSTRDEMSTRDGMSAAEKPEGGAGAPSAAGAAGLERDAVDAIIAAWGRERPDLDVSSVGVVSRVARLSARFARALEANFASHGLTKASFEALAALRRSGEPYRLSQTALMRELSLTPGTVSVRIGRLVEDGLAVRRDDPGDRRGVIVELTPAGSAAFDSVVADHLATERRLLEALDAHEQEQLADLLRRLLLDGPGRLEP